MWNHPHNEEMLFFQSKLHFLDEVRSKQQQESQKSEGYVYIKLNFYEGTLL